MLSGTTVPFDRSSLSNEELFDIYRRLLYPRLIEEKMLSLLRQGQISKWFSGIGQEAISVGCTLAMQGDEMLYPMHRNLGVFTTRDIPLKKLFAQWQGKVGGFTQGRDRSFHFGAPDDHIIGMISHLGPQLSLACGSALSYKLQHQQKASLAFTGEGGTSEGEFHEALNVASVWDLPVLFIIENNGYGLSTPVSEQYRCDHLADRAKGYGMEGITIDGNNILEVFHTVAHYSNRARKEYRPFLIECNTFRMRGHEEASGTAYVPEALLDKWAKRDPILLYEEYLTSEKILTQDEVDRIREEFKSSIHRDIQEADDEDPVPSIEKETSEVFRQTVVAKTPLPSTVQKSKMRFVDAIADGLRLGMERHDNLILMGQDIAEYGGVFKVTKGLVEEFGRERVRNTPLCESAILGTSIGLSLDGFKSMVEMQFADFVSCGFNQIVNNIAKLHYRWGANVDVVIRMPTGGGMGAGPFHSQSNEAWFAHVPGLKIVYPSTPEDAKGLLLAAFEDPDPVMFFEHKGLYRGVRGEVSQQYYTTAIGKAKELSTGEELAIITYGMGVGWAQEVLDDMSVEATLVDLRTLQPLDKDAIEKAVKRCNRVLILHEDTMFGGLGGEISAWINEFLFEFLDAPVMRVASLDTPVPFAGALEEQYMAKSRLREHIEYVIAY